ncbi:serine protease 46-like [Chironomus tepperi]|uniref:serine protease 46-like n=1 Tax=Chironomus tepperi TaxID=113505 RepID=UPI00391F1725
MNILPKLLIIINLLHSIGCINQNVTSKLSTVKNINKVSSPNNRISKLRLILLSDLQQNEIPQSSHHLDSSCWATSQAIKITAKSCPCKDINCNLPINEIKRRAISATCMQFCCGGSRYRKNTIRSISDAQIQQIQEIGRRRRLSFEANCERGNRSDSFVFARVFDKMEHKTICAGVLVHHKFLITTAICVMKKNPHDLVIKFGSYKENNVEQIILHQNFYKSIDTLQHNIALLMLEKELPAVIDLPCIAQTNVAKNLCHVFSWSSSKFFENAMKLDNVEVLSKGECYTSHLILGKKHEKYVNKGKNNICVGNENHHELNIHLSGSVLTCHSSDPKRSQILKGILTWATEINFYPHLFTDVTQFIEWIESTVNEKLFKSALN